MTNNSFGQIFRWTTFGESHGATMGVVIEGCPAGLEFDFDLLKNFLERRRPGGASVSGRQELDQPKILSGVFEGKTLGTPIAIIVENSDSRSKDYADIKDRPRRGHADDMWSGKYAHWDHRGGGRASARETVNWVIAGAVARMLCQALHSEMQISSQLLQVGPWKASDSTASDLENLLQEAKAEGESYGALVELKVQQPPSFLGQPIFHKMKSDLTTAFMTTNACVGVELGAGFESVNQKGSEFHQKHKSELYGGIRGGITTGEPIAFRLAFKPTSSINDVAKQGRHDPCVAIRALPIVEAMTWSVFADHLLMKRLDNL
ncbi:MAG: chorismate synthase [Bdellovibrionales bacterium]|nr:chorismate synthase [Bdellovibrionales bacterium]